MTEEVPDSKRPRNNLQSLLQEIINTKSALSCTVDEGYDNNVLALNNAFQMLVDNYLQPSTGS